MGSELVHTALRDAIAMEEAGGMLTNDGRRRRTLGGTFFRLVRTRVPPDKRRILFVPHKSKPRSSSAAQPGEGSPRSDESKTASEAGIPTGSD